MADTRASPTIIVAPTESPARSLAAASQRAGRPFTHVLTPEEGLSLARASSPSLLLLDVCAPDLPVTFICRQFRADGQLAGGLLLLYSAQPVAPDLIVEWLDAGADDCIVTASPAELAARVAAHARKLARFEPDTSRLDTTERRQAEDELRLLKAIIESSSEAIAVATYDGKLIFGNRAFTTLAGASVEAASQHLHEGIWQSDLYRTLVEQIRTHLAEGNNWQGEFEAALPDGRTIWAWAHMDLVRDGHGNPQYVFVILHDNTDLKQAQASLAESEARSRALLQAIPDILLLMTTTGVYQEVYAAGEHQLYGTELGILGRNFREVLPAESVAKLEPAFERAIASGEMQIAEYAVPVNGQTRHREARIVPLAGDRLLAIVRDFTDHKRAEDELRLFKTIIETSSEGALVVDADHRFVYFNHALARLTALPTDKASRYLVEEFIRSNLHWGWVEQFGPQLVDGQSWQGELELRDAVGQVRPVWAHLDVLNGGHGSHNSPGRLIALIHDVSAERQARETLRLSEARYRGMVESQHDLVIRVNSQGVLVYANEAYFQMMERPGRELIGQSAMSLIRPADRPAVGAIVNRLFGGGVREYVELGHETRHGLAWYGWEFYTVRDASGEVAEVQCVGRDITAFRAAQAALMASNARMRAVLRAVPDMLFVTTRDGTFVEWYPSDTSRLHVPPSDFLGRRVRDVLPREVAAVIESAAERALATGEMQVVEYALAAEQGTRSYEARMAAIDADYMLTIVRDVTEKRMAEARLQNALSRERELNQLKSRFVSMVSHEFRTPLSAILSSVELLGLQEAGQQSEKTQRYLRQIQDSTMHMMALLQDILLLGRIESGLLDFSPSRDKWSRLCRSLVEEARLGDLGRHDVVLTLRGSDQEVYVDAKLFGHILSNLLSNALKYSAEGTEVVVDVDNQADRAVIQVIDHGIGIPPEDQPHIFDTFYRASNVEHVSGTGLGLVIVQRAVEVYGGTLQFESAPGLGTTFVVTLPTRLDG